MDNKRKTDLMHDLVLPIILFAALGGMTWAVRGCSGFGGSDGCLFAGVTWGVAWWFIARDAGGTQSRRYASGWIILALAAGISYSGGRGWMQWPSFFEGHLQTNYQAGEFVPISRKYGFLWLFIAGVPWAGLGACLLAWCGSKRTTRIWQWAIRIACGVGVAYLARYLYNAYPQFFLPLYNSMEAQYRDLDANPNLRRLMNDCRNAIFHLGLFLGFLAYEIGRRDWKNVTLISTVGVVNGIGWAAFQNWKWSAVFWPGASFNFWRCWESSGGISIGIAYGIAYFLVNRRMSEEEIAARPVNPYPNIERFAAYVGLVWGLGRSIQYGIKGWINIYIGHEYEDYWEVLLYKIFTPLIIVCLIGLALYIYKKRRLPKGYKGDLFPHAFWLIWIALIIQNIIAQLITGPLTNWNEVVFSLYYVLLFLITAVVIYHYRYVQIHRAKCQVSPPVPQEGKA
ncbi:MAG TPA: hypothetical protein PLG59_03920 [bacterium]|nr:hypothetical protein [bacterium]